MNRDALISVAITAAPVMKTKRCGGTPEDLSINIALLTLGNTGISGEYTLRINCPGTEQQISQHHGQSGFNDNRAADSYACVMPARDLQFLTPAR